tara:strand:+ start:446 stop:904 length:459 start_codon:yes stop_codon:yes gene_type:complete
MPKYIKPTLTLTSNASSATTDPGPISVALTLSATDKLDVDRALTETKVLDTNVTKILDGSALLGVDSDNGTPGTHGGFVYLRNTTTTDIDIYIGFMAHDVASVMESNNDEHRLLTLKQGEFAWLPFDCTGDLVAEGESGTPSLEYWFFNRGL